MELFKLFLCPFLSFLLLLLRLLLFCVGVSGGWFSAVKSQACIVYKQWSGKSKGILDTGLIPWEDCMVLRQIPSQIVQGWRPPPIGISGWILKHCEDATKVLVGTKEIIWCLLLAFFLPGCCEDEAEVKDEIKPMMPRQGWIWQGHGLDVVETCILHIKSVASDTISCIFRRSVPHRMKLLIAKSWIN